MQEAEIRERRPIRKIAAVATNSETNRSAARYPRSIDPLPAARATGEGVLPMDDRALVEALVLGDPRAPRLFIERHQTVVFGLCLRMMGHRQDAEDVAQETFVRALRGISGFDAARPVRPWLLGIAANRCRTVLGKRKRRPGLIESLEDRVDERPALAADHDDLAAELVRALAFLRPEYRAVFALYHEQNLAYEEIARSLGRPIGTVKTWLHRARAELAELLSKRGVRC
jgi:RNA polymerase sigma-70 factor (ECF subfamily)